MNLNKPLYVPFPPSALLARGVRSENMHPEGFANERKCYCITIEDLEISRGMEEATLQFKELKA